MLPAGPHVRKVFTDPDIGLLAAADPASNFTLFLECSTIDTATSLEVGKLAKDRGHRFVDAPVSGGPNGASNATLTIMVGSDDKTLFENDVRPILETMGKPESIFLCGGAGAGLATKQINNYLSAVCVIGTCEAFEMGIKYGLDPKILATVINTSTGRNYNSLEQNPIKGITPTAAAAKDFQGGFAIEMCLGVIRMAQELGKGVGARNLLGDSVIGAFEQASTDERCRGKDSRSIWRWFTNT